MKEKKQIILVSIFTRGEIYFKVLYVEIDFKDVHVECTKYPELVK